MASIAPPATHDLTLHEAAREAPFTVLAPARVPAGLEMQVTLVEPGWPSHRPAVRIGFHSLGAGPGIQIWQSPAGEGPPPGAERIEREGQELAVQEIGGQGQLWLEREGVAVMIVSAGLEMEALIEVALSLRPAPTEPPPLVDR